jgi:hypothetical protein
MQISPQSSLRAQRENYILIGVDPPKIPADRNDTNEKTIAASQQLINLITFFEFIENYFAVQNILFNRYNTTVPEGLIDI